MTKIKLAVAGVGNCFCSLMQGLNKYKNCEQGYIPGLMHPIVGDYKISDIEVVAAFDVDKRKVGKNVSEAIFEKPNNTKIFCSDIKKTNITVSMGPILDGIADHMAEFPEENRFVASSENPCDVVKTLKESKAEVFVCYLPVGSQKAVEFYANACLEAGVAFINAMPIFICSNKEWADKFEAKGLPCLGDDVKSQLGATILHRAIAHTCHIRGVKYVHGSQQNFGGNTDFMNMLDRKRLTSKKESKTESVISQLEESFDTDTYFRHHIGPADYIPFRLDNKQALIEIAGSIFGDIPVNIFTKIDVEDSPNSAGVIIDAIRLIKIALDRGIAGPLYGPSAFLMKHPPIQMTDDEAFEKVEQFIKGYPKWISVFPTRTRDLTESGEFYSEVFSQIVERLTIVAEKNKIPFWNNSVNTSYCEDSEYLERIKEVVESKENRKENTLFISFCHLTRMQEMEGILKDFLGEIIAVNSPPPPSINLKVKCYLGPDDVEIGRILAKQVSSDGKVFVVRHKEDYYPFVLREQGIKSIIPDAICIPLEEALKQEISSNDTIISFGNRVTEAFINCTKAKIIAVDSNKKVQKALNVETIDQGVENYIHGSIEAY